MEEGGGKLSAVCEVPRAKRHQGAPRPRLLRAPTCPEWALSPRTPDAPTGQKAKTPPHRLSGARRARTRPIFLLPDPARRVRAECDLQTEAPGAGGRGSLAEAQVQKGAGRLGTGLPLPLSPSAAVAASAAVRTDEGSEKQSFSTRQAAGEQTASSAVIPLCAGSTCGLPPFPPDCFQGGQAHRGGL